MTIGTPVPIGAAVRFGNRLGAPGAPDFDGSTGREFRGAVAVRAAAGFSTMRIGSLSLPSCTKLAADFVADGVATVALIEGSDVAEAGGGLAALAEGG
jgi:hypothetical protein